MFFTVRSKEGKRGKKKRKRKEGGGKKKRKKGKKKEKKRRVRNTGVGNKPPCYSRWCFPRFPHSRFSQLTRTLKCTPKQHGFLEIVSRALIVVKNSPLIRKIGLISSINFSYQCTWMNRREREIWMLGKGGRGKGILE